MPRRPAPVGSALGAAIRERRANQDQIVLAAELGMSPLSLSRIERGLTTPSYDTAKKLATWLSWTTDQVMEAAKAPAPSLESTG